MKRKVDWKEEEQSKREDYSDEESDEDEPRSRFQVSEDNSSDKHLRAGRVCVTSA